MWKVISCTEFLWVVGRGLPDDRTRLKGYIFVFFVCVFLTAGEMVKLQQTDCLRASDSCAPTS